MKLFCVYCYRETPEFYASQNPGVRNNHFPDDGLCERCAAQRVQVELEEFEYERNMVLQPQQRGVYAFDAFKVSGYATVFVHCGTWEDALSTAIARAERHGYWRITLKPQSYINKEFNYDQDQRGSSSN